MISTNKRLRMLLPYGASIPNLKRKYGNRAVRVAQKQSLGSTKAMVRSTSMPITMSAPYGWNQGE